MCINLMQQSKQNEQTLTEAFEYHLQISTDELTDVRYEYFDFHQKCKSQKFEKINPLISKMSEILEGFSFYVKDITTGEVLSRQNGIFRLNCFDCLDRVNIVMTKLAFKLCDIIFRTLSIDLRSQQYFGQDPISYLDQSSSKQLHQFALFFKNIWADNGDELSRHYCGTASKITNVVK